MVYECLMLMLMLCKSSYARLTPEVLQPAHRDVGSDQKMFRKGVTRTVTSSATSWDIYMCPLVHPPWVTRVRLRREPEQVTWGSKQLVDGVLERTILWFAPLVGRGFLKLGVSLHVYVDVFG